jgi:hypothetical protein
LGGRGVLSFKLVLKLKLNRGFSPEPSGVTPDSSGVTPDSSGVTPDSSGVTPDSSGVTPELVESISGLGSELGGSGHFDTASLSLLSPSGNGRKTLAFRRRL